MTRLLGTLQGIKVVDLTRVLGGPYCTQILADHGAEVIKVEPPLGDETRAWGPPFVADEMSAYYMGINRNKQSIVVDLSSPEGIEILDKLLADADILIENFKTGTLKKWGIDYEEVLSKKYPKLIHCAVTGFGASGPLGGLPGYDAVIQAMAGLMSVNGNEESGPLRLGIPSVDMVTGLNATIGILLALHERQISGKGQSVDIALYDCGVSFLFPHIPNYLFSGKLPKRTGNAHPNITPYDSYATKTDPIFLTVGNNIQFTKLCQFIGAEQLIKDERFVDNNARCAHRAELRTELELRFKQYDCADLADQLMNIGVPCGAVNNVEAVIKHPHTQHRKMIVKMSENYQGIGSPIKLSRTPASYRVTPPTKGQDTKTVLTALGIDEVTQQKLIDAGIIIAK